jgi:predicted transglutaminase-like cysteine proteinase
MAKCNGAIRKCSVITLAIGLVVGSVASVQAFPNGRAAWPAFTVIAEKSKEGPPGWAEFCRNYKSECDGKSSEPLKITLTPEVWDKLVEVNRWANGHIKATPDRRHWGRINKWYFANDGRGDCKDYVLVKRRMLMEAGLPREALMITVVWTPQNNGHAVLLVRTDKGDFALDNLSSRIVLWNQTPYDYVMRQSQFSPNAWVFIDGDPLKPPTILDDSIVENPLNETLVMVSGLNSGMPKQEVIGAGNSGGRTKSQMVANRGIDDSIPKPVNAAHVDDHAADNVAGGSHETAETASNIIDNTTLRQLLANGGTYP